MILSDLEILKEIKRGNIVIDPFEENCLGTNSYDVHLGETLLVYKEPSLDSKKQNLTKEIHIPNEGLLMEPGVLYLGATAEYTETHNHVPFLEGKSSTGRLGINIHATAGKGDVGFCNNWTLELSCIQPVKIYAGMPIGQLIYFSVKGDIRTKYNQKKSAKYIEKTDKPVESMMWKNDF